MRPAKSIVTVRLDRNAPVHISEVIPNVLGQYRRTSQSRSTRRHSRFNAQPETNVPRARRMQFPLGSFWVRENV